MLAARPQSSGEPQCFSCQAMDESEQFQISLQTSGCIEYTGTVITYEEPDDKCKISLSFSNLTLTATDSDFFEAFCKIRIQLEEYGILPICFGASLNVYPSGMARNMDYGMKAYKLTLGQQSRMNNLVEIFDTDSEVVPSTVEDQKKFFNSWLASL